MSLTENLPATSTWPSPSVPLIMPYNYDNRYVRNKQKQTDRQTTSGIQTGMLQAGTYNDTAIVWQYARDLQFWLWVGDSYTYSSASRSHIYLHYRPIMSITFANCHFGVKCETWSLYQINVISHYNSQAIVLNLYYHTLQSHTTPNAGTSRNTRCIYAKAIGDRPKLQSGIKLYHIHLNTFVCKFSAWLQHCGFHFPFNNFTVTLHGEEHTQAKTLLSR